MDACKHLGNCAHERRGRRGRAGRAGGSGANAPAFLRLETPSAPGMGMSPRAIRRGRLRPSAVARVCDRGRNDAAEERNHDRPPAARILKMRRFARDSSQLAAAVMGGEQTRQSGMPSSTAEWAPRRRHSSPRARPTRCPRRSVGGPPPPRPRPNRSRTARGSAYSTGASGRAVGVRSPRRFRSRTRAHIPSRRSPPPSSPPPSTRPLQASTLPR